MHGIIHGLVLTVGRFSRCQTDVPLGTPDPVPPTPESPPQPLAPRSPRADDTDQDQTTTGIAPTEQLLRGWPRETARRGKSSTCRIGKLVARSAVQALGAASHEYSAREGTATAHGRQGYDVLKAGGFGDRRGHKSAQDSLLVCE